MTDTIERVSLVQPITRREQIRIKAYKWLAKLAKHYTRLAEWAGGKAYYLKDGTLKEGKVYRPETVEPIICCPLCGGRLIRYGCFLSRCEFTDCDYKFGFDEDSNHPGHSWDLHPLVPTNYEEYKQTHMIILTKEKDPEFFKLLQAVCGSGRRASRDG